MDQSQESATLDSLGPHLGSTAFIVSHIYITIQDGH